MVKRKITVTVDEQLVEAVQTLGAESLSAVVNAALASEIDRRSRAAALEHMLADWDGRFGLAPSDVASAAAEAFDDLDASADPHAISASAGRVHRRGVA